MKNLSNVESLTQTISDDKSLPQTISNDESLPQTISDDKSLTQTISDDKSLTQTISDDESLPQTIEELEAETVIIEQMISDNMKKLKELMLAESVEDGIFFAKEIHDQRQNKLILQTRKYLRTVSIRRIRYMESEEQI